MVATVKTVKMQDIYEKNQFYVIIENGERRKVINVGEKTFNEVNEVINDKKKEVKDETRNMGNKN